MNHRTSQEYMEQILQARHEDMDREKELVAAMLKEYADRPESYEYAFAKVYHIDTLRSNERMQDIVQEGNKLYPLLEKQGFEELNMTLANLMAVAFGRLEDARSALACYFKGMEIAERMDRKMMMGTFYFNIGQLYQRLGEYNKAEQMLKRGVRVILRSKDNRENVKYNSDLYHLALATIRMDMGRLENAREILDTIQEKDLQEEVLLLKAMIAGKQNKKQEALSYVESLLVLEREYNALELEEMNKLANLVLELHDESVCRRVLELYDRKMKDCNSKVVWRRYYDWLIEYLSRYGTKERVFAAYENYYTCQKAQEKDITEIYLNQVRDRENIESTRYQNTFIENYKMHMKGLAQRDELTGAANRSGMEQKLKELFDKSREAQCSLGVIFVDVDYFKEYNDLHGHLEGDHCLCEIYEALMEGLDQKEEIIRYGGDEFVVLLMGLKDSELEEQIQRIRRCVHMREIFTKSSLVSDRVTVTMGAVNKIPKKGELPGQYLQAADEQLYQVKKSTRDGYAITHEIE